MSDLLRSAFNYFTQASPTAMVSGCKTDHPLVGTAVEVGGLRLKIRSLLAEGNFYSHIHIFQLYMYLIDKISIANIFSFSFPFNFHSVSSLKGYNKPSQANTIIYIPRSSLLFTSFNPKKSQFSPHC